MVNDTLGLLTTYRSQKQAYKRECLKALLGSLTTLPVEANEDSEATIAQNDSHEKHNSITRGKRKAMEASNSKSVKGKEKLHASPTPIQRSDRLKINIGAPRDSEDVELSGDSGSGSSHGSSDSVESSPDFSRPSKKIANFPTSRNSYSPPISTPISQADPNLALTTLLQSLSSPFSESSSLYEALKATSNASKAPSTFFDLKHTLELYPNHSLQELIEVPEVRATIEGAFGQLGLLNSTATLQQRKQIIQLRNLMVMLEDKVLLNGQLKSEREAMKFQNQANQFEHDKLAKDIQRCEESVATGDTSINFLSAKADHLGAQIKELIIKRNEVLDNIASIQEAKGECANKRDRLAQEMVESEMRIADVRSQQHVKETEHSVLLEELNDMEEQFAQLKKDILN